MAMLRRIVRNSAWITLPVLLLAAIAIHAQAPEMAQRAQDDIARAEAAERALVRLKSSKAEAWAANPNLAERETTAGSHLAEAKLRLQTGKSKNDFVELTRASALAMRATQEFEEIVSALEAWKAPTVAKEVPPEDSKPQTPVAPAGAEPSATEKPGTAPPAEEENAPLDASGQTLETIIQIPSTPSPLQSRAVAPPPSLWAAADAYFKGDYKTTLDLLAEFSFDDSRAVAQAYLFRSAAGFAIDQIERADDESVLKQAAADAKRCIEEAPGIIPSERYFSPKYRAFFDQQR